MVRAELRSSSWRALGDAAAGLRSGAHDKTFSLHDLTLTYHLSSFNNTSDLLFLLSALAWRASWYLLYTHSNCLLVPLIKNIPLFDAIVDDCLRLAVILPT